MQNVKDCKTELFQLINDLPEEKVMELFDYARFLVSEYCTRRVSQIDRDSLLLQQQALSKIWDNAEEDLYDL
ncbi:MAG: hypothetical protein ABRQ39_30900 [Candidatus Eremiobacterota bacterium]